MPLTQAPSCSLLINSDMGGSTPTLTWHPKKSRMLLVGTAASDKTTEIWASLCANKDAEKTPRVKLYMGDSTNTTGKSNVIWLDELGENQFNGPKAKRQQARMGKIRECFATISTHLPSPSTTPAESSPPPLSPRRIHSSLSPTSADRYYEGHVMSDEEIKTARSIMIAKGTIVPPLPVMIQAKKDSLIYGPSMSPCKTGCWIQWQYQQYHGFGEQSKGQLATEAYLPATYTLTTVSYDTVKSIMEHFDYKVNDDCVTAKLSRFFWVDTKT